MASNSQHPSRVVNERRELALRLFNSGDLAAAEPVLREIVDLQPDDSAANQMLAIVLIRAGRETEAEAVLQRYLRVNPRDPAALVNLGELYRRSDKLDRAVESFSQAIRLAPAFAEAHFNLANTLKGLGRHGESIESFRRAIELKPDYAKAHYNLANALLEEGRVKTAVPHYQKCLELKPAWPEAHLNLANAYSELGQPEDAIAHYRAIQGDESLGEDVDLSLGHAYLLQGDIDEARASYLRHAERRPEQGLTALRAKCLCEPIAPNLEYIDAAYRRIEAAVEEPRTKSSAIDLATLHSAGAEPPMALAYYGQDAKPVMSAFAQLFNGLSPPEPPPFGTGKPRVGIVVTHGHEGVFARCLGGLVERLSRDKLDVQIICSRAGSNILRHMMPSTTVPHFVLPKRIDEAADQIRGARFDLLHYWEVGTDAMNYFLPFLAPAPLQAACWGWPITTGNPQVDFYVSANSLEPPDGEQHYSEQLVRFESLPTWYERPTLPPKLKGRETFGLSDHDHLYLCAQNLRKYHPDFDEVIAGILRADSLGRVLIISDAQPAITQRLLSRFRATMPDVHNRIQVLPRMEREVYLNVLALADVALDTLHYGGGANTVLDACLVGTPMVTLPGAFHRGRWTYAVYRQLGLDEPIALNASDYVQRAIKIACEPNLRVSLKHQVREVAECLYENQATVAEHDEFFSRVIAKGRSI